MPPAVKTLATHCALVSPASAHTMPPKPTRCCGSTALSLFQLMGLSGAEKVNGRQVLWGVFTSARQDGTQCSLMSVRQLQLLVRRMSVCLAELPAACCAATAAAFRLCRITMGHAPGRFEQRHISSLRAAPALLLCWASMVDSNSRLSGLMVGPSSACVERSCVLQQLQQHMA